MAQVPPYYCPRSCHKGRTYPTLSAVIKHVALQHPDYDPNWWITKDKDEVNVRSS